MGSVAIWRSLYKYRVSRQMNQICGAHALFFLGIYRFNILFCIISLPSPQMAKNKTFIFISNTSINQMIKLLSSIHR